MHKLSVGNLGEMTKSSFIQLLNDNYVTYVNVEMHSKRAIVDFADQNSADLAIDLLNGLMVHDVPLKVEPISQKLILSKPSSLSISTPEKSVALQHHRIIVNCPLNDIDWYEFERHVRVVAADQLIVQFEKTAANYRYRPPAAIVSFTSREDADAALVKLDQSQFGGIRLKAYHYYNMDRSGGAIGIGGNNNNNNVNNNRMSTSMMTNRRVVGNNMRTMNMGAGSDGLHIRSAHPPPPPAGQDMPLRMVVDAKYVGAIIGQGGANIRDITKESKARCVVDVQRAVRDQSGNLEKVISIYGQPENCSKACIRVLEVVLKEAEKENDGHSVEPELKLRAHNQLVGRLIGKGGATIKKLMEDTKTTVFVSNEPSPARPGEIPPMMHHHMQQQPPLYPGIGDPNAFNMERTITIRGSLEAISQAELRISSKLRQSYESDLAQGVNGVFPFAAHMVGAPALQMPGGGGDAYVGIGSNFNGPAAIGGMSRGGAHPPITEVVHMWVPNNMVGALIGTKGVHIRNVMRLTGAHIRIEGGTQPVVGQAAAPVTTTTAPAPTTNGGAKVDATSDERHAEERLVTITGTDQQQYKAQFWIYQRVAEQSYHFFDEIRLATEVSVPSKLVGRIIGKGGQNVRELQRITGAQVKIPEDVAIEGGGSGGGAENDETIVRVVGNFQACQAVQSRLRQLVHQFQMQSRGGGSGGGGPE